MFNKKTYPYILVVEDEDNLRRLFMQYLTRDAKYIVDEADCGEIALDKIAANHYDLVVTDMQMAAVSGLDVLRAAKEKDQLTQVLIVTGYGSISTAVKAMQQGAYEYLTKPLQLDAFGLKVTNAIERRKLLLTVEEQQRKLDAQHKILERDLELAKQVQATLVPEEFITDHIRISVNYLPMLGLGGDFTDIYQDRSGEVYINVIDVTGHGIAAALVVNRICSELRKLVRACLAPNEILYHINEFFFTLFADTGMFLTIMAIKCDLDKKKLYFAGSAHPAALLWRQVDGKFMQLESQNPIIGFEAYTADFFHVGETEFSQGDKMYVFTDGILEAENNRDKPLGLTGFKKIIRQNVNQSASLAAPAITEAVLRYSRREVSDDILLLVADFLN